VFAFSQKKAKKKKRKVQVADLQEGAGIEPRAPKPKKGGERGGRVSRVRM